MFTLSGLGKGSVYTVRVMERLCLHCQGLGKALFTLSGLRKGSVYTFRVKERLCLHCQG